MCGLSLFGTAMSQRGGQPIFTWSAPAIVFRPFFEARECAMFIYVATAIVFRPFCEARECVMFS